MASKTLYASFPLEGTGYRCVFIADQNVAFAGISLDGQTGTRVWLYNCKQPPYDFPEPVPGVPLLNPRRYIIDERFEPVRKESEVSVKWRGTDSRPSVELYLRGKLHATMTWGEKPGRCILAKVDNGLGRKLAIDDDQAGTVTTNNFPRLEFPLFFGSPRDEAQVVLNDEGAAIFAYYLVGENIVSHVWLYNTNSVAPTSVSGPPINSSEFIKPGVFEAPKSAEEFDVRWTDGTFSAAHIFLRGELLAILDNNPVGRCALAAKDGPLARVL